MFLSRLSFSCALSTHTVVHFFDLWGRTLIKRGRFFSSLKSNFGNAWVFSSWREKGKENLSSSRVYAGFWTCLLCNYLPSQMFYAISLCAKLCTFVCLMTVLWNTPSRWTLILIPCTALPCSLYLKCVWEVYIVAFQSVSQKRGSAPINSHIISVMCFNIPVKHICPVLIGSL